MNRSSVRSQAVFVFDASSMTLRARCPACEALIVVPAEGVRWADERATGACAHYLGRYAGARVAESVAYFSARPDERFEGWGI